MPKEKGRHEGASAGDWYARSVAGLLIHFSSSNSSKNPREIGKRNFHPRFNSWSILSLGKVHLVAIEMNKNK